MLFIMEFFCINLEFKKYCIKILCILTTKFSGAPPPKFCTGGECLGLLTLVLALRLRCANEGCERVLLVLATTLALL